MLSNFPPHSPVRIRTEPRYIAKLAYLIPNNKKEQEQFANVIILRLYANAFSPLEEFLLLDLLGKEHQARQVLTNLVAALEKEVSMVDTIDEFVSSENVVARMIISYNSRKQGKQYVRKVLTPLIRDLINTSEAFGVGPGGEPKLDLLSKVCLSNYIVSLIVNSIANFFSTRSLRL